MLKLSSAIFLTIVRFVAFLRVSCLRTKFYNLMVDRRDFVRVVHFHIDSVPALRPLSRNHHSKGCCHDL